MTANIFGDSVVVVREPAWHSIGKFFPDPITAKQAVVEAHLDYEITTAPMTASVYGQQIVTPKHGIFRQPTPEDPEVRFLGAAGGDYTIVQNAQIAEIIDPLTEKWPVASAGALGVGETVFFALDAGEQEVRGELLRLYFGVTDTRNGGTSLKVVFTPVRFVCQNTLVSGLRQAVATASLPHDMGIASVLEARVNLLKRMQRAQVETLATFEKLAAAAITGDDAASIFAAAYPRPPKSQKVELLEDFDDASGPEMLGELYDEASRASETWKYYCTRTDAMRTAVAELYNRLNDEHPSVAGTAWAAYNAVVEFADYRQGAASMRESALFGARAAEKKRAFAEALRFTQ